MSYRIVDAADVEPVNGVARIVRQALGVDAFGINQLEWPPNAEGPEHDHAEDGQQEVYAVVRGGGVLRVDGREEELRPGLFVYLSPEQRRQVVAGPEGLVYVGVGCPPGSYTPQSF